ncbi:hydantoinase B/oxoprolinase family protein [Kordiimonas marina]|uniref:hydantoinase B/oxoprolinase family protein n=1 Tax=Kordiimonas marina TaxID=2872312 RepID=UPI001FF213CB|nr:hydantoinase B/oxoprolinase family protein [Kordiimonas marina]MCJ9429503.1 hydantoinase B/oxoprolinase family protein [Kordiimonas marina]
MTQKQWQFWIDRGGTFTDVVARHPDGALSAHKYLSENPGRYQDAAVFAMREIMDVPEGTPFPAGQVSAIKMGTTVATNALLERAGEPTLLMITQGFKDALYIGQQHRADLFALQPARPEPLYAEVAEVTERMDAQGAVVTPLDEAGCRTSLQDAYDKGFRSVAIALVHGYRAPDHEKRVAEIARDIGFTQISASHAVSPLMKLVPRGDTTVADAYLSPILRRYVEQVRGAVGDTPLYFMQSNGGLAAAHAFEGKDAVLSGPAGGIVGAAKTGERAGSDHLIGFDMGGTSTDVSHYAGAYERVSDTVVAGVRMTVPMMDIHTVAAGGGSICRFEDGRFRVGPQSAGAYPGPAAYGRGGPITVTDCNVMLGKLSPALFPAVFGESGKERLNKAATEAGFREIADEIEAVTGERRSLEAIAEGFLLVAVEHMARAIKRVSVERGHDIKKYSLLTFGGAGGQHACLVADALGIERVIVPPFSGVLSALGMGLADQRTLADQAVEAPLDDAAALKTAAEAVSTLAQTSLAEQGIAAGEQVLTLTVRAKYQGTDTTLSIPYGPLADMTAAFEAAHKQQFGFTDPGHTIIAEAMEAEAAGGGSAEALTLVATGDETAPTETISTYMAGERRDMPVYDRARLKPGHTIQGPALILENGGTTVLEPGWSAEQMANDTLILSRTEARARQAVETGKPDPIMLEIFNNLFMSVAEEMGAVLAKTAHSVNVKERLDFSCAVFDTEGNLIANAPHMPVHLGSMGESVSAIIRAREDAMQAGDVFMLNDPYAGGTHLPDITVISPVFLPGKTTPDFYVASRGHHADIGGISPGSMPPASKTIEEEGIRFTDFHLVKDGRFQEAEVRAALAEGPYPARNPDQNIADLKAQVAANERGIQQVTRLVTDFGADVVAAYMGHVQDNAEEAVRRVIDRLHNGECRYAMDCGAEVAVKLAVNRQDRTVTVDFTGTSGIQPNNFNAPLAVTKAAILYVFRVLTGEDIPLNAGCLKPVKLVMPEGCMLNPVPPAAVVAGNVETSQVVTNALFLAARAMAGSQGTMNNLTFGNDAYQYYETIAGGTGAGPGFDGVSAIQSHMTNSRLTDAEVLEWRYPVRVEEFSIRAESGGDGKWHGGNGARRVIRFLEDMDVAILSGHRKTGAPGLDGGMPGAAGRTLVIRADGTAETMAASDRKAVKPGDCIVIETPGGGGYGHT